ncbi:MAG: hypothetical protein J0L58_17480 [Burkholderiales bacterium]|nr:hypothetical protein [Burkholderiales bacterium]
MDESPFPVFPGWDDPVFEDPLFWAGVWEPELSWVSMFEIDQFYNFGQKDPKKRDECRVVCKEVVDDAADIGGVVCGGVGAVNPLAGVACAAGVYVGRQLGRRLCWEEC